MPFTDKSINSTTEEHFLNGPARKAWEDYAEEKQNVKGVSLLFGILGFLGFAMLSVFSGSIWEDAHSLSWIFLSLALLNPALAFIAKQTNYCANDSKLD